MKKIVSVSGRVFLGFILFLTLIPFYLLLSNSFKWSEEIVKKPFTLPTEWHFTNYAKSAVQVIHPMANTLLVTFCVIVIVLIAGTLAAYTFVRFRFKRSNIFVSGHYGTPDDSRFCTFDSSVYPDYKTKHVQYLLGIDISPCGSKFCDGNFSSENFHGRSF